MYSDNIRNCRETVFSLEQSKKLNNMRIKAHYSDSFRRVLKNIPKEEILELLEEYDGLPIYKLYNFEQFYKNKHKIKGRVNE